MRIKARSFHHKRNKEECITAVLLSCNYMKEFVLTFIIYNTQHFCKCYIFLQGFSNIFLRSFSKLVTSLSQVCLKSIPKQRNQSPPCSLHSSHPMLMVHIFCHHPIYPCDTGNHSPMPNQTSVLQRLPMNALLHRK